MAEVPGNEKLGQIQGVYHVENKVRKSMKLQKDAKMSIAKDAKTYTKKF